MLKLSSFTEFIQWKEHVEEVTHTHHLHYGRANILPQIHQPR